MSETETKKTITPIALEGGFRGIISETLIGLRKNEKQKQALVAELESTCQSAAKFQNVDLKIYVLDVDTLDFVERPAPPEAQAVEPTPDPEAIPA